MSKSELQKLATTAGRLLLAFVLIFSQVTWAGQAQQTKGRTDSLQNAGSQQAIARQVPAATTPKPQTEEAQVQPSGSAVAEQKSAADSSQQGIKVHGHWTIEVRNPDGTVVTHREFENSLASGTTGGSVALSTILARQGSVVGWQIMVGNLCPIAESFLGFGGNCTSTSLTVQVNGTSLVLSGQGTAGAPATIASVSTTLLTCAPATSPPSCASANGFTSGYSFTSATASSNNPGFTAPISVIAGQIIALTVNISFS